MWLPRILYEPLPFYYIALGAGLLAAAFFVETAYWPEILAGCGLIVLLAGVVLILRRKGYRASRSRLDFDESA